jgi:hypothetical protein
LWARTNALMESTITPATSRIRSRERDSRRGFSSHA